VGQGKLFRNIDGELSGPEKKDLDAHLAACESCRREYRLLTLPKRLVRGAPEITPSPYFFRKLRTRIEVETQNITVWQIALVAVRHLVPALAAITLALLSVFAYMQLRGPETDLYGEYRVFLSDEQPNRTVVTEQGEMTDENVLSAIADSESSHHRNQDLK
jgi:predicted anti-sigma-YlaC factor YlaD